MHQEATGRLLCVIFSFVHVPYICHEDQEASRHRDMNSDVECLHDYVFLSLARLDGDQQEGLIVDWIDVCYLTVNYRWRLSLLVPDTGFQPALDWDG